MIKYEMNRGEIGDFEIKGDIAELCADMSTLYYMIASSFMKEGLSYYAAFEATLMKAFDNVDRTIRESSKKGKKTREDIVKDLVQAIFGGSMEEFEEAMKAKAKEYADAEGFNDEEGDED